jgi:galactokinase/mevalonate kinase-like predicted kinase
MTIRLSIPGRINILGNPGDANEGDFGVLSAAVEIRAHACIEPAAGIIFGQTNDETPSAQFPLSTFPLPYTGDHDLLKAAFNRLTAYSPEFAQKITRHGFSLKVRSDVPRQSGLGGSSLFVLLALAGLRELYALDRRVHNDYVLSELAQRVEARELGITAGYADRYIPLFGGLAYVDYRSKLLQTEIQTEPYATYERLDQIAPPLNFVAVSTGMRHESGDIHGQMRPKYLLEHAEWQLHGGQKPAMLKFMSSAWECAWKGKIALLQNDLSTFGNLMTENHHIVDEMMHYCGFEDGAGWANNLFIDSAIKFGALGAKLTGAGGGGSVFALVAPENEDGLMHVWQSLAETQKFTDAHIYKLKIAHQGLIVEK